MAYKRCLITNNNPIQLLDKSKYYPSVTKNGITFTNNGDGTFTINGTTTAETELNLFYGTNQFNLSVIEGYKYLFILSDIIPNFYFVIGGIKSGLGYYEVNNTTSSNYQFLTASATMDGQCYAIIRIKAGKTCNNETAKFQLFDLTEMFGAGNEPTTVAEFRALYPNELYPYNPTNCVTSYKKMMKVSDVCQLLDKSKYHDTFTVNGVTLTNNRDGTITTSGTATNSGGRNAKIIEGIVLNPGKYCFYTYDSNVSKVIPCLSKSADMSLVVSGNTTFTISKTVEVHFGINVSAGNTYSGYFIPQLFDLTEMYGAGNEPTTVAAFREKFPEEMYPYSPQCFVTAYKNNMVAKTKNLFDAENLYYKYDFDLSNGILSNKVTDSIKYLVFQIQAIYTDSTYTTFCTATPKNGKISASFTYSVEGGKEISYVRMKHNGSVVDLQISTLLGNILELGKTYTVSFDILSNRPDIVGGLQISNIQIEKGSTATDYVPYGYL